MAFLPLCQSADGSMLRNGIHHLMVYKVSTLTDNLECLLVWVASLEFFVSLGQKSTFLFEQKLELSSVDFYHFLKF